jgi:predicted ATPase
LITRLAVSGYRSIRHLVLELDAINIVTGANGSGKTNLYRALRLLAETAQGRLVATLAREGGMSSALWAGPERITGAMRRGEHPVQGTRRSGPVSLKLGFSGDDYGYAVDLGYPAPDNPFPLDPEIKAEAMWTGELLARGNMFADRRGPLVQLRTQRTGEWRNSTHDLSAFDSMMTHCADPDDGAELLLARERMRSWRFYDALRTDPDAPARRPQVMTYTPVLASDGSDLAAAIATIFQIGDRIDFAEALDDAFPGSTIAPAEGAPGSIALRQPGLLRPLSGAELSDGTLRYLLLMAALLSPRPPELMILNEPESSLHPSLLDALARLLLRAARRCQIILVSHSDRLVAALAENGDARHIRLEKDRGETNAGDAEEPRWNWLSR